MDKLEKCYYQEMHKKSLTEIILDGLQEGVETSVDLFDIILSSYPNPYRRIRKQGRLLRDKNFSFDKKWSESYLQRKRFNTLLSKLKHDGLVVTVTKDNKNVRWKITRKGSARRAQNHLRLPSFEFPAMEKKFRSVVIVSYDIPEKYKRERGWIRRMLISLDFSLVHKSVWLGQRPLPEELIRELKERALLEYVHIFEISKSGTLTSIAGTTK